MKYDRKGKIINIIKTDNELGGEDIKISNTSYFLYKGIKNEEIVGISTKVYLDETLYKRIILTNVKIDINNVIETEEGNRYFITSSAYLRGKYLYYLTKYKGEIE